MGELWLLGRAELRVDGVTEVLGVTEDAVVLRTELGTLLIQGEQLQLRLLDPEGGRTEVAGKIAALRYEEPRQGGWLRRLLG